VRPAAGAFTHGVKDAVAAQGAQEISSSAQVPSMTKSRAMIRLSGGACTKKAGLLLVRRKMPLRAGRQMTADYPDGADHLFSSGPGLSSRGRDLSAYMGVWKIILIIKIVILSLPYARSPKHSPNPRACD
jgi:hypothetical protein